MELVSDKLGLRLNHIPYRGGAEVRQALLGGRIVAGVDAIGPQHRASGQFRVLNVWPPRRLAQAPDVPTLMDIGAGFVETSSFGIGAPRDTPAAAVSRLHAAFRQALEQPAVQELFERENLVNQHLGTQAYLESVQTQYAHERKNLVRLGLVAG